MADVVSPAIRSRMMSGIQARNTKPEMVVRSAVFRAGLRFRLHNRDLPGTPDMVLKKHHVVVMVNGCFWHFHSGCGYFKMPATRTSFWREKLLKNRRRDLKAKQQLHDEGWRTLIVWECAVRAKAYQALLAQKIVNFILGRRKHGEITLNATGKPVFM